MAEYIALLRKDEDSDFGVEFPDFPGCVTAGTSLEDARKLAAEALALHIEGLLDDGEEVPRPSDLDVVAVSRDAKGAVPFMVSVPLPSRKAKRINVTIDEEILGEIDQYAEAHGISRSGFLSRAAVGVIRGEKNPQRTRAVVRQATSKAAKKRLSRAKKKKRTAKKAAG